MSVKVVKRSVAPVYLIGAAWLGYALLRPLRTPAQFLACAALSALAYVAGRSLWPDRTYWVPDDMAAPKPEEKPKKEEDQPKTTGNPEVDAVLKERDRAISEMRRLNENIPDEKLSAQIDHLEEVTKQIIGQVAAKPEKLPQIRRFMDYYLPTTLKILNAYDRMGSTGISGENIDATKDKVERMMDTIVAAYDKQLDSLFGEEALDISTDITVMENLLAREGLGGMTLGGSGKPDGGIELEL